MLAGSGNTAGMNRGIRLVGIGSLLPALVLAAVLVGCGETSVRDDGQSRTEPGVESPAVGFTFDPLPAGYEIRSASEGQEEPEWSSDSVGGVHPKVLLVPDDWAGVEDQRWVIVESYDSTDNQSGIDQELPEYQHLENRSELSVNGNAAVVAESRPFVNEMDEDGNLAFIAVDTSAPEGSEFGVGGYGYIVSGSVAATVEELMPFTNAVREAPQHLPVVIDPPDGWRVLASLTGEQVVGSQYVPSSGTGARGKRLITLAGPAMSQQNWISVASLPGNAQTAQALAIAASSSLWSAQPTELTEQTQGSLSWVSSRDPYRAIYATVSGSPFLVHGPERLTQDDQSLAELLRSLKVVDDPTWEALVARTTRTAAAAPPGSRLLIQGSDDELTWSLQTDGREPMPPTTVVGTPAEPPRVGDVAELVIQPSGQVATVGHLASESWPSSNGVGRVSVYTADALGTVPGWLLIVDAPPAAAQAVYFDGSTSHTIELHSVEGRALGGIHLASTFRRGNLLHESVELLAADGSKI